VVRQGSAADLPKLAALYASMMEAQGGNDRSPDYFNAFASMLNSQQIAMFCCEFNGELDCAIIVGLHGNQVTLHLGATSGTKRAYKKMLLPIWAAAEWAHDRGASCLDLGGVPPPHDTDAKRRKIAQFKFDFASTLVELTPMMYSAPTKFASVLRKGIATGKQVRSKVASWRK
jgi:lipid II:glycine glycyltransferase (peptidoglycan interpeptide bridge formation enzyme)